MEEQEKKSHAELLLDGMKATQENIASAKVSIKFEEKEIEAMYEGDMKAACQMSERHTDFIEKKVTAYLESFKIFAINLATCCGHNADIETTKASNGSKQKEPKGSFLKAGLYLVIMVLSVLSIVGIDWFSPAKKAVCQFSGISFGKQKKADAKPETEKKGEEKSVKSKVSTTKTKLNEKWGDRVWFLLQVALLLGCGKLLLNELKKHLSKFKAGFKGWQIEGEFRKPEKKDDKKPEPKPTPEKPKPQPEPTHQKPEPLDLSKLSNEDFEKELERRTRPN